MRLTVHHSHDVLPLWQESLSKLLQANKLTIEEAHTLGEWHVATFNDRVVGLAISKGSELRYFAVRDLTRRRGIGRYLLADTIRWLIEEGQQQVNMNISSVTEAEQAGLQAFLRQAGFHAANDNTWTLSL
jgi:GNAT superfamily N-acetyltransferase